MFGQVWDNARLMAAVPLRCFLQVWVAHSIKMHKQEFAKKMLEVVGTGILFSEGDQWQRQRRLLNPAFSLREIKVHTRGGIWDCHVSVANVSFTTSSASVTSRCTLVGAHPGVS